MDQESKEILAQTIDGFIKSVTALRLEINVYFFKHMAAQMLPTIVAAGEGEEARRVTERIKEKVLQEKKAQQEFGYNLKLLRRLKCSLEGKVPDLAGNEVKIDDWDQWLEEINTIMERIAKKVRKQQGGYH